MKVLCITTVVIPTKTKLFSNLYFRAVSGRLVINIAVTLIYDVKKAIKEKNVLSTLAFDIKVAFDNFSINKLIKQLLYQKVPLLLVQ